MSVEQPGVIDGMGISREGDNAVLLISDHLAWDAPGHLEALTAKIEAYANVILSGEIENLLPSSRNIPKVIHLVYEHLPLETNLRFLAALEHQLDGVGVHFKHGTLPPGY